MRQEIRELTQDAKIYGISTIIGRFLTFLLVPFYTHFISPSEMGIFANVYAYIAFLNIFYICGLDVSFMKFRSEADAFQCKTIFSTAAWFSCILTIGLSLVLLALRRPFLTLMAVPLDRADLFPYVLGILLFDTLSLIPYTAMRMERSTGAFTAIRMGGVGINLGLNLLFFIKLHLGITAIFAANMAGSLFSFLLLLPMTLKNIEWRLDGSCLRRMLGFGLPYLPATLASMIVQVIDRPIVQHLTNSWTLGLYQAGYKLGIFMMLVASMFQFAWQPFFLSHARDPKARILFARVLTLFVVATALIWAAVSLFIEEAARFLVDAQFLSGLVVTPIVLLAYLIYGLCVNFQAGLTIADKTRYFPLVTGASALVNVAANFLLIPRMGIIGAALATLIAYIVMAAGLLYYSQRFYPIPYEFGKVGRILAVIGICAALYYFLYFRGSLTTGIKAIMLLGFMTSLLALRVVGRSEISGMLESTGFWRPLQKK